MSLSNITRWVCLFLFAVFTLLLAPGCSKQASKERHLKRADAYFAAKDFEKAVIEYLNVLKLDGTNVAVVKRIASIYFDQGKIQEAMPFLLGLRQADPNDLGARIKLAQIFMAAQQLQDARQEAIYVLDRDPKNDDAILLLADTSATPADHADTQQRLQKLQAQAAGRAAWHLASASLSLRQTNYQAAEGALRTALSIEPQSSPVHMAFGMFYWLQKDLKNADLFYQKATELAPLNPAVWLRRVEFKLNAGLVKEAKDLLQQITQKLPDSTAAWAYLARIEFDGQNYAECSNVVQRILSMDRANFQARLLHAGLTRLQGNPAEAVKEAEELKRAFPGSPDVEFELAQARLRNQERPQAMTSLKETLRLNPNNFQAALILAELQIGAGDTASAVTLLQSVIRAQPGLIRAQLLLGSAYSVQRRFDDALALYQGMEQRFPTNPAVPFLSGLTLRQQPNQNVEARKAFQRAAVLSSNDLLIISQLVELDVLDRNYPAAFQRVRDLLVQVPKSSGAKLLEARIYLTQTNWNAAEAALQQALAWDPNFAPAYGLLTQIYVAANRLPEALGKLQQMLEKDPKNVQVLMQMGDIYDKQGDAAKAARSYEDLIKLSPSFVPALNNLAYLYSEKLGKYDEALALASKARELAPQEPHVADTLGRVHFHRREYTRALALLQECVVKLPEEPEVQFHLGMAYYMMGQEQPARLAFQRALERNEPFSGKAESQKRLALLDLNPDKADPATVTSLETLIRQQPDDLPALLRLGRIYERTGSPDKARQAYEDARKANPNSAPVILQLARLHASSLKNPQQALVLAREARKLAPEDAEIAYQLGRLAAQNGDSPWATSLLQESAQKMSGNPEVFFHLAHALFAIGRVNDAEDTMRRAVSLLGTQNPPLGTLKADAQWFQTLVGFYKSSEKRLEAEAQVQQLLKARPDYLPASIVAALIQEQRGRHPEARQAYETILAANPEFAPARKQLAGLYTDHLGDQQKALEMASKAREVLQDDSELAKTLGKIAYRRNDFPNAVRFLQESSLKRGQDSEVFYFLGMAHYQRKAKDESTRALDRALSLNPAAPYAAEVKKVLAELKK